MIEIQTPAELIPPGLVANLTKQQLIQLTRNLADVAKAEWIRLGKEDGSSRRSEYIKGIQKPVVSGATAVIALVGTVANMLEHGDSGVNLRDTLLGSNVPVVPRGQRGKQESKEGGYYRAIPFRHATPGAEAQVVGQEMGKAYSGHQAVADAKKLGREVYGKARKLKPYSETQAKPEDRRLPAGMAPKLKDHHKTDIFAGMIREEKTYEKATQSQYFTFRTISTHITDEQGNRRPATVGWKRGPIRARNYAKKVSAYVAKIAAEAAQAMLEAK